MCDVSVQQIRKVVAIKVCLFVVLVSPYSTTWLLLDSSR